MYLLQSTVYKLTINDSLYDLITRDNYDRCYEEIVIWAGQIKNSVYKK